MLENVNVTCQDFELEELGNKRCLDISINHRFIFRSPILLSATDLFGMQHDVTGLEDRLDAMHIRNKRLLASLLLPAVAAKIPGLGDS